MAKEGNEEQGNADPSATLGKKIQAVFDAGAIFNFGQPKSVPKPGRKPREDMQVFQKLANCIVEGVHDGGAWIGITYGTWENNTYQGGQRCKTDGPADVKRLRELIERPNAGETGVHLKRV